MARRLTRRPPVDPVLQVEVLKQAAIYAEFVRRNRRMFTTLYPWQRRFIREGATKLERMLEAANRVGKGYTAGYEVSCHLTGDYPDDWDGARIDHEIYAWGLGVSGDQLVSVMQRDLFGELTEDGFTGGLVSPSEIVEVVRGHQQKLAREVRIRHKNGRLSVYNMRATTQTATGQSTLPMAGFTADLVWVDEQCPDDVIHQFQTRLMTGRRGKGGLMILTWTPELGVTPFSRDFRENPKPHRHFQRATWDDAPHITPEVRQRMLDSIPEWQWDLRSKGIPVLGSGLIYPIDEERLKCDPFEIPRHFRVLRAIDLGMAHPTAAVWLAHDTERDCIYLTRTYRRSGETPGVHASAINSLWRDAPVVFPHDADNREKGSGVTMAQLYRDAGIINQLSFANADGSRFVEPGIVELYERMRSDRFKVFRDCSDWFAEVRGYHRDDKGKILKIEDDLMDATRYGAIMIPRYGRTLAELRPHGLPTDSRGTIRYAPELEGLG